MRFDLRSDSRYAYGGDPVGFSIVGPSENYNDETGGELRKDEGNDIIGESESISISVLDERNHSMVIPWSRLLKKTALGVLGVSAMWVKFIVSWASFLAALYRNPNNTTQEAIAEQEDGSRRCPPPSALTMSAPTSSLRAHGNPTDFWATVSPNVVKPKNIDPEHKHNQSKAKKYRRAVSMDNRPTKPERSDSFYRSSMAYDYNVGENVMIITLLFFIFYGPFCAISFTCACFYLIKMFIKDSERINRINDSMVDLQSSEYRRRVIKDN